MLKVWRAVFARRARDERGSEFAGALFVFPILFILIIGSIEVGFYVQTRMRVENIARDAARQVAADGGNFNKRTNPNNQAVDARALPSLMNGSKCRLSQCKSPPTIDCKKVTRISGATYRANTVDYAGETVTCKVTYPYKQLSGGLMDGAMGLGIGGILQPFTVEESARSETGSSG